MSTCCRERPRFARQATQRTAVQRRVAKVKGAPLNLGTGGTVTSTVPWRAKGRAEAEAEQGKARQGKAGQGRAGQGRGSCKSRWIEF